MPPDAPLLPTICHIYIGISIDKNTTGNTLCPQQLQRFIVNTARAKCIAHREALVTGGQHSLCLQLHKVGIFCFFSIFQLKYADII